MTKKQTLDLLDLYAKFAHKLFFAGFDVRTAESVFVMILELIETYPFLKEHVIKILRQDLIEAGYREKANDSRFPYELILFLVHGLRWEEFSCIAKDRLNKYFDGDVYSAQGDIAIDILRAERSDWEDRDFYLYFEEVSKRGIH